MHVLSPSCFLPHLQVMFACRKHEHDPVPIAWCMFVWRACVRACVRVKRPACKLAAYNKQLISMTTGPNSHPRFNHSRHCTCVLQILNKHLTLSYLIPPRPHLLLIKKVRCSPLISMQETCHPARRHNYQIRFSALFRPKCLAQKARVMWKSRRIIPANFRGSTGAATLMFLVPLQVDGIRLNG